MGYRHPNIMISTACWLFVSLPIVAIEHRPTLCDELHADELTSTAPEKSGGE